MQDELDQETQNGLDQETQDEQLYEMVHMTKYTKDNSSIWDSIIEEYGLAIIDRIDLIDMCTKDCGVIGLQYLQRQYGINIYQNFCESNKTLIYLLEKLESWDYSTFIENVISICPEIINHQFDNGKCLLHFNVCPNWDHVLDIDIQDISGNTPLHIAIHSKNYDWAELLLNRGANPFIQNKEKKSPMDMYTTQADTILQVGVLMNCITRKN